ncbi:Rieske 2Fe-2S domain-containing protein [Streptacidiphilus sp. P02-A3a]|uniref:Rieske 2Fe-2S domain-containing protein n=1 Tax=Streptacidiphilus sp. P02-A3a TaxID=2704468 RepID=UPI0015F884A4|nr:Rieske 2Fe-2S domain-containing protein [Streptacidiphilus sp. P02-A3a]QMU69927.1 Rieske 2Fe-2S domain-containing protein [Streptacidiphilus sp. P02-A3a]
MKLTRTILESASRRTPVGDTLDRIDQQRWLDNAVGPLRGAVRGLPLGDTRDLLHGVWLGHPLHPTLVQVPIGAWSSAAVLDLLPGQRRAATVLVAVGLAGAVPAALAGWVDWAEQHERQMRVGVVHAAANATGAVLYAASLAARLRGRSFRGRMLGFAGLAAVSAGGVLGGHLAFRQAAGANHAEDVPHVAEPGWHSLGQLGEFPLGRAERRMLGEVPVLVVQETAGVVRVLADRCSHLSGPLSEGKVADGCVECPWHGSRFRLADGGVAAGPATAPQPVFETKVVGDRVQARPPAEA